MHAAPASKDENLSAQDRAQISCEQARARRFALHLLRRINSACVPEPNSLEPPADNEAGPSCKHEGEPPGYKLGDSVEFVDEGSSKFRNVRIEGKQGSEIFHKVQPAGTIIP